MLYNVRPRGKRQHVRSEHRWAYNVKSDLKELGCDGWPKLTRALVSDTYKHGGLGIQ